MVILWAVVPRRELGPLEKAAQLNRQKHLPQLEKETSPLAFGVKLAPRHNSAPPPPQTQTGRLSALSWHV